QSNIAISGDAPSVYLKRIEDKQGISKQDLDDILRSHLIEPDYLRSDDFDAFFSSRTKSLSSLITEAMGKPVVEEQGTNEEESEDSTKDSEIDEDGES
ncbi:MAG TPA: hypothetical protein PKH07_17820, partial [bacterium]|nr:hypothetical protein [bacterium]